MPQEDEGGPFLLPGVYVIRNISFEVTPYLMQFVIDRIGWIVLTRFGAKLYRNYQYDAK